jgi:hypothetical protein
MKAQQSMNVDQRSAIMMQGNTWAYNFLTFALLFDILYRAMVWNEAAWDLYALLFAGGVISLVYAIRHKVLNRNTVMLLAVLGFVAAASAAVVAIAYSMT